MEKAPGGTSVGVDDPYAHVDRCDFVTDAGQCRWALDRGHEDPEFADARSREEFQCPVAGDPDEEGLTGPWNWVDCPHFRRRNRDHECYRCGLEERRAAHDGERPLLEEHHLSYPSGTGDDASDGGDATLGHEITIYLCRWCHAKVHKSWAAIDDDASPDPEAVAEREGRLTNERDELGFQTAAERLDDE